MAGEEVYRAADGRRERRHDMAGWRRPAVAWVRRGEAEGKELEIPGSWSRGDEARPSGIFFFFFSLTDTTWGWVTIPAFDFKKK